MTATVQDSGLIDISLQGYQFTWSKSVGIGNFVEELLDSAMANSSWWSMFRDVSLHNLVARITDQSPLLVQCTTIPNEVYRNHFKFENSWLQELDLSDVVHHGCLTGSSDAPFKQRKFNFFKRQLMLLKDSARNQTSLHWFAGL